MSSPTSEREGGNGVDTNAGGLRLAHNDVIAGKPFILSHEAWQQIIFQNPLPVHAQRNRSDTLKL